MHGLLEQGGKFTTINDPLASTIGTWVSGVDSEGTVVGWYYNSKGAAQGFVDSKGTFRTIRDAGAGGGEYQGTYVADINDKGS